MKNQSCAKLPEMARKHPANMIVDYIEPPSLPLPKKVGKNNKIKVVPNDRNGKKIG